MTLFSSNRPIHTCMHANEWHENTHVQRERHMHIEMFSVFLILFISFCCCCYSILCGLFDFIQFQQFTFRMWGKRKNRKHQISTWKRNAKVAQTDGSLNVLCAVVAVAVAVIVLFLLLAVTIETAAAVSTATVTVVTTNTRQYDSCVCIDFQERETIKHFFHRIRAWAVCSLWMLDCSLARCVLVCACFFTKYRLCRNERSRARVPMYVRAHTHTHTQVNVHNSIWLAKHLFFKFKKALV